MGGLERSDPRFPLRHSLEFCHQLDIRPGIVVVVGDIDVTQGHKGMSGNDNRRLSGTHRRAEEASLSGETNVLVYLPKNACWHALRPHDRVRMR